MKDFKITINYLKFCVVNRYFLFSDLTITKKTLIMKSILRDKIIKNIYFIADNNPRATEKITVTPMGINEIKDQFFGTPIEIENLPYNWEYWQKLSDDASIELDKLCQQERYREEQLELKNNETTMDENDYFSEFLNQNGINACPPFHLIQRQGTIPRLAVHIEDWCKILEETGGDELEIKAIHELIDSNNSDTKKRAILQNNKKYSEAAKKRENKNIEKYLIFIKAYKDYHANEVEAIYQEINSHTLSYELAKKELNKTISKISSKIYEKYRKDLKLEELPKDPYQSIERAIKLYEAEKIFKKEFLKYQHKKEAVNSNIVIAQIANLIDKLGLIKHLSISRRAAIINDFYINLN